MNCESSFTFGKTATAINEAYIKMYATSQNLRTINEADDDFDPEDAEEIDAAELSGDFDADSEYDSIMAAERRQKELEDLEGGDSKEDLPDIGTKLDAKASTDDDEESEENKSMPFSRLKFDDEEKIAVPDFHFTIHRGTRQRYPEYLRAAAARHGYKLPDNDFDRNAPSEHVRDRSRNIVRGKGGDSASVDDGSVEDNFYENVILANPEEFNEEFYDMDQLNAHRKEIFNGWTKWSKKYIDVVRAVKMALEEISGCGRKVADTSYANNHIEDEDEDGVGDIDSETSVLSNGGFSAIIKYYDPGETAASGRDKLVKYKKADDITGKSFNSKEEAIEDVRREVAKYVDDPSHVYVGVILSNELVKKLLNRKGHEYERDEEGNILRMNGGNGFKWGAGKRKIERIDPVVYKISSSNKELTDRMLKRENGFKDMSVHCDEYLNDEK